MRRRRKDWVKKPDESLSEYREKLWKDRRQFARPRRLKKGSARCSACGSIVHSVTHSFSQSDVQTTKTKEYVLHRVNKSLERSKAGLRRQRSFERCMELNQNIYEHR